MNQNKMGIMPIPELVLGMSIPIMVSMLVQSLYNIVDSVFVSQISENALTATSIAYSAQMLQIAFAVGTGVGVNAVVSRFLGAKKFDKVNQCATIGLILTVATSLMFVLWGMFGTRSFISLFTNDEMTLINGTKYLKICQLFATGLFLETFFQRLLQATGRTFLSMLAQMAGALVNIVLDPIMIFGYFGCPALGIEGAAIATVIGQWSAALLGFILHLVLNKEIHFDFKHLSFDSQIIKLIYKVGAPTIIMQSMGSIMVAFINIILGTFETAAVTFFGVYYKLQSFLFMPMNGLGQGTLPIVAYNFGAKQIDRVKEAAKTSILSGAVIGLLGTVLFMIFPENLLHLFNASQEMLTIGISGLRIISLTFVLASVTMIIGYLISGLGNGNVNMIATFIRQLGVLLPCVYLFGNCFGLSSVWFAFVLSEGCAFVFALFKLKKTISNIEKE